MSSYVWNTWNLVVGSVCVVTSCAILVAIHWYGHKRRMAARRRAVRAAAVQRLREQQQQHMLNAAREPLPSEVRESLHTATFPFLERVPGVHQDSACPICLVEYEETEELIILPCKHAFHRDCVGLWFDSQSTCPICRCSLLCPSLLTLSEDNQGDAAEQNLSTSSADDSLVPVSLNSDSDIALNEEVGQTSRLEHPSPLCGSNNFPEQPQREPHEWSLAVGIEESKEGWSANREFILEGGMCSQAPSCSAHPVSIDQKASNLEQDHLV